MRLRDPAAAATAAAAGPTMHGHAGAAALTRGGTRRLILGTASPARKAVLAELLGPATPFSTAAADLDEKRLGLDARARGDARVLVLELAVAKGDALADALDRDGAAAAATPALIVSADQVVVAGPAAAREIREKPSSADEAAGWIAGYAAHPPSTISGLAVTAWPSRTRAVGVHEATVVFAAAPTGADLAAAAAAAAGCAGALKIEGPAAAFIDRIEGGRDSVFGLPTGLLLELVARVDAEEEEEAQRR